MNTLTAIDTRTDLIEWVTANMPGASVHDLDGELIIHTGLEVTMGDYLSPITCPDEGDIPIQFCTCKEDTGE